MAEKKTQKKAPGKKLVIVESPAKAKTIGKFLGASYVVLASQGHVRDLPKSKLGVEIDDGFAPNYIQIRGRKELFTALKKAAATASRVYLATDPDREGEAIAWHIAALLNIDPATNCRVTFNEITQRAVTEAIKAPRPVDMALVNAQQARRVLDRLVGYQISPLLWANVKKRLSAGRVQSAADRLLCEREDEIESFVPRTYYTIEAMLQVGGQEVKARLTDKSGTLELETQAEAEALAQMLEGKAATAAQVKKGRKQASAPPPFTTSLLQQEAARKLGFTTKRTMMVAQQLYEGIELNGTTVGLVTYIRTDGVRLGEEALENVRQRIADKHGADYLPEQPNVHKGRKGAQDAHEAIRPTYLERTPDELKSALSADQFKLYRLIYQRTLASQMTPALYDTLAADFACEGHNLRYAGESLAHAGYRAAYIEGDDEELAVKKLPAVEMGDAATVQQAGMVHHETTPPPRYTEATLVRAMENLGIGRPSTYAPTISTLLDRNYAARESRSLLPTALGRIVNGVMVKHFPLVAEVSFTAAMEDQLDELEEGQSDYLTIMKGFYAPLQEQLVEAEKTMEKALIQDEVSEEVCDKCGALMVYKQGRFGRFLACPKFPECRNTKNIVENVDVPCPQCGGQVQVRRTKTGRVFYGCAKYPECDYRSWDMPSATKCPECGGACSRKKIKGVPSDACNDKNCGWNQPLES